MSMNDTMREEDDDGDIIALDEGGEVIETDERDDNDGDDERLGDNQADSDDDITDGDSSATDRNRKKRRKQKELRKKAREYTERELTLLRQQNMELLGRLQAVENHAVGTNVSQIDASLAAAQQEIRQAEYIIGRAVEAGNGEDVATAIRLRDDAQAKAAQLFQAKQQAEQIRQQMQTQAAAPRVDPRVTNYAQEWHRANPWYKPNGTDEDSLITKAIDSALVSEGWDPSSEAYWHELTKRVSGRIGDDSVGKDKAKKRKAPPMGTDRQHAPATSRNEIYVSKERKDAMIEAGVWDDPTLRKRYLKAYQAYDRGASR